MKLAKYIMMWVGVSLLFSLFMLYGMKLILGYDLQEKLLNQDFIAENLLLIKLLTMLNTICWFLVPALLFTLVDKHKPIQFFKLNHTPPFTLVLLALGIIVCSFPLISASVELNNKLPLPDELVTQEENIEGMIETILSMKGPVDLLVNLVLMAFLPALAEEVFFRGGLQKLVRQTFGNPDVAIIATSIVFSAIHFQFSGFLPRMILGILFGYMYYWSRNLWVPIACHFVYNGSQVILVYLLQRYPDMLPGDADAETSNVWVSVISIFLLFLLLRQFYTRAVVRREIWL